MASRIAPLLLPLIAVFVAVSSTKKIPPCRFTPAVVNANGTVTAPSRCGINGNFTDVIAKAVEKFGSPQAKADFMNRNSSRICNSYNVSSGDPAAKQACQADRANRCHVFAATGTLCLTDMPSYLSMKLVQCEGSNFWKFNKCLSYYVDECDADPDCVWSEALYHRGAQNVETERNKTEARIGGPLLRGACYWKPLPEYALMENGTMRNSTEYNSWLTALIGDPKSNQTAWEAARGTCSYAKTSYARNSYTSTCSSFNTKVVPGGRELDITDNETAAKCDAAGCTVTWVSNAIRVALGQNVTLTSYTCSSNQAYLNNLMYDPVKDRRLIMHLNSCTNPAVQVSEERCNAVRV